MSDSPFTKTECGVQQLFTKAITIFGFAALAALILLAAMFFDRRVMPTHPPGTEHDAALESVALAIDRPGWKVYGAWRLETRDGRLGALSGLTRVGRQLVAVNDFGYVSRFDPPVSTDRSLTAMVGVLKGADGLAIKSRDTEAISFEHGEYWISREGKHALLKVDRRTLKVLQSAPIAARLPSNGGVEALIPSHGATPLIGLAERSRAGFVFSSNGVRHIEVVGVTGSPTDAARLQDGRIVILSRSIGLGGFRGWVALAKFDGQRIRVGKAQLLPTGWRDNVEGLAVQPLPTGADRLWIVSDDDARRLMRSVLLAIDVEADAWP